MNCEESALHSCGLVLVTAEQKAVLDACAALDLDPWPTDAQLERVAEAERARRTK